MGKSKRSNCKRSNCKNRKHTKKQAGGFRYCNLHTGDVLVSASSESSEPLSKSRSRSRTRSRTRSKTRKTHKKWF